MRTTTVGVACLTLLLSTATAATAAPPTHLECGDTVSGVVRLAHDLHCDDVGLVLEPGAVLDLDGHRLVGPGRDAGGVALQTVFEDVESDEPVVVRNGRVAGWGAVFLDSSELWVELRDLVVADNGTVAFTMHGEIDAVRTRFARNSLALGGFGVAVHVRASTFVGNDTGVTVAPAGGYIDVHRSTFVDNDVALACSEGGVDVTRSTFRDNGTAVLSEWCVADVRASAFRWNETAFRSSMVTPAGSSGTDRIVRNTFAWNDVALQVGVRSEVIRNVFRGNDVGVLSESAGTPFEVEDIVLRRNVLRLNGDGIYVDGPAHVGGNLAVRNSGYGIYAPQAVDLGGNVAHGNGTDCVGVDCGGS